MTTAQKIEAAAADYAAFRAAQGAYYSASMAYARALGAGTATEAQRLELGALKAAYEAA